MTAGRLVLDGGDLDAVRPPSITRVLARSAARALRAGRGVAAYGPDGDAATDPAPCGCHATARAWPAGQVGRWVLPPRQEGLPVAGLLPVDLAAAFVAALAVGTQPPAATRHGMPLGLSWRVWALPSDGEPHRHTAADELDLVTAAAAVERGMHLELTGPYLASAAVIPEDDGAGWTVQLSRLQGRVAREVHATTDDELLVAVRVAAAWVVGADPNDQM